MPATDIQLGQRFRSDSGSTWEVYRFPDLNAVSQHVVLIDVNDHRRSKLISEIALMNANLYNRA